MVVLGAGHVGKTAIINRFLKKSFTATYKQTVEDLHCKDYDVNGTIIRVDILDTAGHLSFPAMRRLSITTAHALLLVYAIEDRASFLEMQQIWEQVKEQKEAYQDLPCVVVANKSDLKDKRAVTLDEARDWARNEGMESAFMEVSCKEDENILQIFQKLLEQARIPDLRILEPLLKRRLSANSAHMNPMRERLKKQEEGKLSRSRSLIRRASKPKVKHTGDPSKSDCVIS